MPMKKMTETCYLTQGEKKNLFKSQLVARRNNTKDNFKDPAASVSLAFVLLFLQF